MSVVNNSTSYLGKVGFSLEEKFGIFPPDMEYLDLVYQYFWFWLRLALTLSKLSMMTA